MPKIKLHDLLNIKSEDYVKIRIKLNQHTSMYSFGETYETALSEMRQGQKVSH